MSAVQKTNDTENDSVHGNPAQQPAAEHLEQTPVNRVPMLNQAQIKCLLVFAIFAVIGFGPVSPGCLIGMFIVAMRPQWFLTLIANLYANLPLSQLSYPANTAEQTKQARVKCFLSLLGLFIIDIAPVPVTPVIAFGIILARPIWFYRIVSKVYGQY